MDEAALYRRRKTGRDEPDGLLEANPVADDLPEEANDALGRPARGHDEVAAGADRDLSVALEPAYGEAEQAVVRGDRDAAMTSFATGPGATSELWLMVWNKS